MKTREALDQLERLVLARHRPERDRPVLFIGHSRDEDGTPIWKVSIVSNGPTVNKHSVGEGESISDAVKALLRNKKTWKPEGWNDIDQLECDEHLSETDADGYCLWCGEQ